MRQFDVFIHPITSVRSEFPYLVNLQSDYLEAVPTRVCASLYRGVRGIAIDRLEPVIPFEGENLILSALDLATFRISELKNNVGNIGDHRDRIIAAIDIVMTGV